MASLLAVEIPGLRHSVRDGVPLCLSNPTIWVVLAKLLAQTKGSKTVGLGGKEKIPGE
jgi:hypothetical protein